MKLTFACVFFLLLLSFSSTGDIGGLESVEDLVLVRKMLLTRFMCLDLVRIISREEKYLRLLNANFDHDNQSYFIEESSNSGFANDGFLILLKYKFPGEVEITVFPPDESGNRLLRCRVRMVGNKIIAPIVFVPNEASADLQFVTISAPGSFRLSLR